MAPQSYLWIHR